MTNIHVLTYEDKQISVSLNPNIQNFLKIIVNHMEKYTNIHEFTQETNKIPKHYRMIHEKSIQISIQLLKKPETFLKIIVKCMKKYTNFLTFT